MKKTDWRKLINADYASVFGDERSMKIFIALLGRGYFPRQLPPPFNSRSFSSAAEIHHKEFRDIAVDNLYKKRAEMCKYSLARPGQLRRILGIPNPAFYFLICLKLAKLFEDLELKHTAAKNGYSVSFPKFEPDIGIRAFEFSSAWDQMPAIRLRARAQGRYVVTADIARFFPSVYTHSIPWALHGKEVAKSSKSDNSLDGNFLDLLVRNAQGGQTLGIPIGPDTSFIISECILSKVDELLYEKLKTKSVACFHRVDDYEFVCTTQQDAEYCLAILQEALQTYELELNTLKTQITELPQLLQESEVAELRNFEFENGLSKRRLLEYYDLAFSGFKRHPKGTLKYAIKRIPTTEYYDETIGDFMAQCMLLEPGVIEAVFVWLTRAECIDKIDKSQFVANLSAIIQEHSVLGHSSEVAWAIWGFLLLQSKIPREVANAIVRMKDPIVLLLALDANEKEILSHKDLSNHVKNLSKADRCYGRNWILSYEAANQEWLQPTDRKYITDDPIFSVFKNRGVSFYETEDIERYQSIMKDWDPYNPYVAAIEDFEDIEGEELEF